MSMDYGFTAFLYEYRLFFYLAGGVVLLIAGWWCLDWVQRKLHALGKAFGEIARLEDHNRELNKEVSRLRGEKTAAEAKLHRIGDARKDLEEAAVQHQQGVSKWQDAYKEIEAKLERAKKEVHELREQNDELEKKLEQSIDERDKRVQELDEKAKEAAQKARELEQKAVRLDWRVRQVAQSAGRIWETPVKTYLPEFRKRTGNEARRACIISLMNLKGGVGKSTIAANLGATLWRHFDRRVLLVDLDFQSSLSSLCLPAGDIDGLRRDKAFVQRLFHRKPGEFESIYPCLHRIRKDAGCKCEILATDEDLADLEEQLMMQWVIGETDDDIRYRLRSLFHSDLVQQRYDYILLDCPPRNTTASINALAASDYMLIPVLMDQTSADAVPRMLSTLRRLKNNKEVPLCPELQVMGVVANRVLQDGKLTPDEQQVWNWLKRVCKDHWDTEVEQFERSIPDRIDFARAAGRNELAVLQSSEIQRVFIDLAKRVDAVAFKAVEASAKKDEAAAPKVTRPITAGKPQAPAIPTFTKTPPAFAPVGNAGGSTQGVVFPTVTGNAAGMPPLPPAANTMPAGPYPPQGVVFPPTQVPRPPAPFAGGPQGLPGTPQQIQPAPLIPRPGRPQLPTPPRPSGTRKPRPK
jgi:cellulose biosynthesis protein BcsQ